MFTYKGNGHRNHAGLTIWEIAENLAAIDYLNDACYSCQIAISMWLLHARERGPAHLSDGNRAHGLAPHGLAQAGMHQR